MQRAKATTDKLWRGSASTARAGFKQQAAHLTYSYSQNFVWGKWYSYSETFTFQQTMCACPCHTARHTKYS
jgi:hypothetical protein